MEPRPALRADLGRVTDGAGELLGLHDPLLDRRVNLGPVSRVVIGQMDGARDAAAVVAAACASAPAASVADAEAALRALLLMGLLEGSGAWVLERARQVRAGAQLPILVPEGTRFGCQGSGDCCRSYSLGPLTDDDHGRLLAGEAALRAALPQLAGQPLFEERPAADPDDPLRSRPRRYLRMSAPEGGARGCVFLSASGRCGVHAVLGEAQKPGFCRLYPYQDLPTLLGVKLYDGGECASFAVSARSGPFLEDEIERVLALLPSQREVHHPLVFLPAGEGADGEPRLLPCDYGHLLRLQEALTARALGTAMPAPLAEATEAATETAASAPAMATAAELALAEPGAGWPAGPERAAETLAALGRMARRWTEALTGCALTPAAPERAIAAALRDGGAPRPEEAEAEAAAALRGREALEALMAAMREEIAPSVALAEYNSAFPFHFRNLVQLDRALAGLLGEAPRGGDDAGEAAARRSLPVVAAPPGAPEVLDEIWRRSLGYQVFGRLLCLQDRPVAGLLRIALCFLVGCAAAHDAAAARGSKAAAATPPTLPTLQDFNAGHQLALRALTQATLEPLFLRFESCAFDAVSALPLWGHPVL